MFNRLASAPLRTVLLSVLGLALLLSGCTRPGDGEPGASATPTASPDESPSPSPTTTAAAGDYTTTGCEDPPDDFELLCEVTELIRTRYLDPPPVTALAEAAAEGLEDEPGASPADGFACALPASDFRILCDALSRAGGPERETIETAIRSMMQGQLDPNSAYQTPQQYERSQEDQSGQVEGIGALVTTEDRSADDPAATRCPELSDTCRLVIVSVFEDAPADRAGLEAGDLIVGVDGQSVEGRTIDDVVEEVRGPSGTEVELEILRGDSTRTVVITRAAVEIPVTETQTVGDVAYLRFTLFTGDSDERFEADLRQLLAAGPDTLVLDLRSNPGGSLDAAVAITSEFLDDGLVLRTRSAEEERDYEVREGGLATDPELEIVVVVDRGSASASEVLAAALNEAGRATIVGERTFGKDTVQQTFPLEAGGALKLTIAQWVTPDGDDFGEGLEPDIALTIPLDAEPEEVVEQVMAALP